ncbi:MAG TPA: hypothetical protein VFE24_13735 [Pirellulales bacterium]|jgi:hypothetical protein|nr:hypothetical protein [Pirellulales bacterium]
MARRRRLLPFVLLGLALVLAAGGATVYWAVHRVPEFYVRALAHRPAEERQASEAVVRKTTALASDLRKKSHSWQAVFTADQINGWLAVDLPENHPHVLPPSIHDPRVDIQPRLFTVAAKYDGALGSTVLSLEIDLFLPADPPDTIAIRIKKLRAGSLPIGMNKIIDAVARAAKESDWILQWRQLNGDPVAYLTRPPDPDDPTASMHIDKIELRAGEVFLSGHTGDAK